MAVRFQERIDRLDALLERIPSAAARPADHYPDARSLLLRLESEYRSSRGDSARLRMLQRDLDELFRQERLEIVNHGNKPFRYRRLAETSPDELAVEFTIHQIRAASAEFAYDARLNLILDRFARGHSDSPIPWDRIRVLPDGMRLVPASIRPEVMISVLESMVRRTSLKICYRDAHGKRSSPTVHPRALIQRGPRIYLYALKEDEDHPVRQYALHRMIRASACTDCVRILPSFDIDDAIRSGIADFSDGELIVLRLRARGYVAELLHDCALGAEQRIEDEPVGSDFDISVTVVVPNTGQLLRWLLGCGDNIEVLAPLELRAVVAAQAGKTARLYLEDRSSIAG